MAFGVIAEVHSQSAEAEFPEALLGRTEQALIAEVPGLAKLAKPSRGSANALGKWQLQGVKLAGQTYNATFFVKSGLVTGIEYLSTAPLQECKQMAPFESAKSELSKTYGDSRIVGKFENGGRLSQSTSFLGAQVAVTLYVSVAVDTCFTRLSYKFADVKDASNL